MCLRFLGCTWCRNQQCVGHLYFWFLVGPFVGIRQYNYFFSFFIKITYNLKYECWKFCVELACYFGVLFVIFWCKVQTLFLVFSFLSFIWLVYYRSLLPMQHLHSFHGWYLTRAWFLLGALKLHILHTILY